MVGVTPAFFESAEAFRAWLDQHHGSATELWVGFYRKGSGRPSITWPQSVDEALCFGWIDGVRKSLDDVSYVIRFTPRRARSIWSAVNIDRATELLALGRMRPAGVSAFAARDEARSRRYAYEREHVEMKPEYERALRAQRKAWSFFQAQTPSYRKLAAWWVMSAKREATRRRRLDCLIEDSAAGRLIPTQRPREKES